MNKNKYSITFACYNSVKYTKLCIDSMIKHRTPLDRLIVIDNGSTDETRAYLESLPLGGRIFNQLNLGCGVAWNQGALAQQAEWTIVMNNDVLVSPYWIEKLINTAEKLNVRIISPALIEGPLDYDFDIFECDATKRMSNVHRIGAKHAVCLAVHNSVWMEIGFFQPVPRLLGYEDTLFFNEVRKSKIPTAMTGACWLHHYGSITQTAIKLERGMNEKDGLGYRYNYKLLNQSWLDRKLMKHKKKKQEKIWRSDEVKRYDMSIHGIRENNSFRWI